MSVLVLSGGGSRGAFEVGVLKKLVQQGKRWDVIAGVSVGALNGSFLAQYVKGEQPQGVADLEQFWLAIKGNQSIYKDWWFPKLASLWKGGVYNTAPLKKLVYSNLDPQKILTSGVELFVGATCVEDGQYRQTEGSDPRILDWVMASSAFPIAFNPQRIEGRHYIDGGVRNVTPLSDMIGLGYHEGDLVIASPITRDMDLVPGRHANNVVDVALRTADILVSEVAFDDFDQATNSWAIHAPQQNVIADPLTFDPVQIRRAIQLGYDSVK